jgi:hypothetical protein
MFLKKVTKKHNNSIGIKVEKLKLLINKMFNLKNKYHDTRKTKHRIITFLIGRFI